VGKRSPFAGFLVVGGITIVGLALRLPPFGDSLYQDELSTNLVVNGFGVGSVLHIVQSDQEGTPPLFFLLTWITKGFGGVEGLRVVSLLAVLASIPLTYLLGLRTVGRPAATVGAVLIALSPFQIFYATEARAYALMMFFCLAAAVTLLLALESRKLIWWLAYGLSVAGAAYTHYTSVFVLVALFGWAALAHPEARRPLLLANLGALALYLPWVPALLDDRHSPAARVLEAGHPLTLHNGLDDLAHWSVGLPFSALGDVPGVPALGLIAAGLVVGAIAFVHRARMHPGGRWTRVSAGAALVVVLAIASPLGAVLHNLVAPSVFIPRNLIASWPGLALLMGAIVTTGKGPLRIAAVVLVTCGFAIAGLEALDRDNRRPDYTAAAAFIDRTVGPGSPVVEVPEPTPGAQTELEAALAPTAEARPSGRRVLSLAFPSLETRLEAVRAGNGGGLWVFLPAPTVRETATEAVRLAGAREIALVVPGDDSLEQLEMTGGAAARFLSYVPPSFRETDARTFPGFGDYRFTVHLLQLGDRPGGQGGAD
jgi:hypothetical protein